MSNRQKHPFPGFYAKAKAGDSFETEALLCPKCGGVCDGHTRVQDSDSSEVDRKILSVCFSCGSWNIFEQRGLRIISDEEICAMDAETLQLLQLLENHRRVVVKELVRNNSELAHRYRY